MNHRITAKYGEEALYKVVTDVATSRTIAFPVSEAKAIRGLRMPQVGVVEKKRKLQVIPDLMFGWRVTVQAERKRFWSREVGL